MKNLTGWLSILLCAIATACDGNGNGDAGIDSPLTLDCASYCSHVQSLCTGDVLQYSDEPTCLASCGNFPVGALTDTAGWTLGCHVYHVSEVAELGAEHCDHAGPAGGTDEGCGTPCEAFCSLVTAVCTGANEQYTDVGTCMTACAAYPNTEEYSANVTSGDSLACRLAYAVRASTDAAANCPSTAATSTSCM